MDVGQFIYCGRHAGIHNNHLATVLFVHLDITGGQMIGVVGVQRPSQKHLCMRHIRHGKHTGRGFPGHHHGIKAAAGFCSIVDRTEGIGESFENGAIPLGEPRHKRHRIGTTLRLDLVQVLCDFCIGLFPRNLGEPAAAFGADPFHGGVEPVLPIKILPVGGPLGAQGPLTMRVIFGPLNLDDFPILYINIQTAVAGGAADIADALFDLDAGFRTGDLCFQQLFLFSHDRYLPRT